VDGGADGRPVFVPRFEKLTNSISFPVRVRGPPHVYQVQSSLAASARVCVRRRAVCAPAPSGYAPQLGIAAKLGRRACTPSAA